VAGGAAAVSEAFAPAEGVPTGGLAAGADAPVHAAELRDAVASGEGLVADDNEPARTPVDVAAEAPGPELPPVEVADGNCASGVAAAGGDGGGAAAVVV
jgi:hypothetical protein